MSHPVPLAARLVALLALTAAPAAARAPVHSPEPDPPHAERPAGPPARAPRVPRGAAEWVLHRSADGMHPDGREQALLWLMNRARQDPTAEGVFLATSSDPDVAGGRSFFGVNVPLLQSEFAALSPEPPGGFDRRLYDAALVHSLDMIARDSQDHIGQFEAVDDSGFEYLVLSGSAFAFAESPLHAHAALNIDWGQAPDGMQTGRGHRMAIMGDYDNVGFALAPESSGATQVGPLVFTGNYANANTSQPDHFARFLVGTVWQDLDQDGLFEAGEGFAGVTVTPDSGGFYAVTSPGGGYAVPIGAGSFQVSFSGGGIPTAERQVTVGAASELLDLEVPEPTRALLILVGGATLRLVRRRRAPRP